MEKQRKKEMVVKYLNWFLLADCAAFLAIGIYNDVVSKNYIIGAIVIFIFLRFLDKGKLFFKELFDSTRLNKAIFFFLFVAMLSTIFGISPHESQITFFNRYIVYFLMFFIGISLGRKKANMNILILALLAGSVVVGIGVISDLIKVGYFIRMLTSFGSGIYESYFLCTLSFFIGFIIFYPSRKVKVFFAIASIPLLIAFFAQGSRGAFVGLFLAVIATAIFYRRDKCCLIGLILIAIVLFLFVPLNNKRFHPEGNFQNLSIKNKTEKFLYVIPRNQDRNFYIRTEMWEAAFNIFKIYPVLGAGPGVYGMIMYDFYPNPDEIVGGTSHLHAHNSYFEVLAEMGAVGLASFLWIFILFLLMGCAACKHSKDFYHLSFMVMFLSVAISDLFTSTVLIGLTTATMFWFLLGLGVASFSQKTLCDSIL